MALSRLVNESFETKQNLYLNFKHTIKFNINLRFLTSVIPLFSIQYFSLRKWAAFLGQTDSLQYLTSSDIHHWFKKNRKTRILRQIEERETTCPKQLPQPSPLYLIRNQIKITIHSRLGFWKEAEVLPHMCFLPHASWWEVHVMADSVQTGNLISGEIEFLVPSPDSVLLLSSSSLSESPQERQSRKQPKGPGSYWQKVSLYLEYVQLLMSVESQKTNVSLFIQNFRKLCCCSF